MKHAMWMLFSNGKVWAMLDGRIGGVVPVTCTEDDEESWLDAVSHAATGDDAGLAKFSTWQMGLGQIGFDGDVSEWLDEHPEFAQPIEFGSPAFRSALATQYGLTEAQVAHAIDSAGDGPLTYPDEASFPLPNGLELRCPAAPSECSYVRYVIPGRFELEVSYWTAEEFAEDAQDVLGAVLGQLIASKPGRDAPPRSQPPAPPSEGAEASSLELRWEKLAQEIPDDDGALGIGYRHALESLSLSLAAQGVPVSRLIEGIDTAADAYGNHADLIDV